MTTCPECKAANVNHDEIVAQAARSPIDAGIILGGFKFLDNPYHHAINDWFMQNLNAGHRRFVIMMARNHGKALALDTKIPTPTGWTTMGEIEVGDEVISDDGTPATVTYTSPIFTGRKCYELTFSNRQRIIADADHLWTTNARVDKPGSKRRTKNIENPRPRTTEEIKNTLHYGRRKDRNHSIDMPGPMILPKLILPLDPYILGMWLGDGSSRGTIVYCSGEDLHNVVFSLNFAGFKTRITQEKTCFNVKFYAKRLLTKLNLKRNKHIPKQYLRASHSQRLDLLQGLMDTDGTISKTGDVLSYTTVLPQLADDFCELLSTFGIKYSSKDRQHYRGGKKFGKSFKTIQFHAHRCRLPVFRLRRKLERMQYIRDIIVKPRSRTIQITAVEETSSVPTRCISVDSDSSLFLCGKTMIPTHNTVLFGISYMLWRMAQNPDHTTLYRMASADNAKKTLKVVAQTLAISNTVAHFCPHLKMYAQNPDQWISNATSLQIPRTLQLRDPTVEVRSTTSLVTGAHANTLLNDDLIDEVAVYSDVIQSKGINIIKNSDSMMQDQQKDIEIIIGTMWAGPFYDWLLDPEIRALYKTIVIGAEVDDRYRDFLAEIGKQTTAADGEPVWPEKFTKTTLENIEKKDKWHYQSQWLNKKVTEEGQRFLREDLRFYTLDGAREVVTIQTKSQVIKTRTKNLQIAMFVDPATGESKRTDQSAIVITGFDKETSRIYVLEAWDGRPLPHDLITKILDLAALFNPKKIYIEDVAFQKTLKHFLKQEMMRRNQFYLIKPAKPGMKSKGARIVDALQPYIANNQVYFQHRQRRIISELVELQVIDGKIIGRSPNLVDALSYGIEDWRGTTRHQDNEDIPYEEDPDPNKVIPAYNLKCST